MPVSFLVENHKGLRRFLATMGSEIEAEGLPSVANDSYPCRATARPLASCQLSRPKPDQAWRGPYTVEAARLPCGVFKHGIPRAGIFRTAVPYGWSPSFAGLPNVNTAFLVGSYP